jgi:hypothetical protein
MDGVLKGAKLIVPKAPRGAGRLVDFVLYRGFPAPD